MALLVGVDNLEHVLPYLAGLLAGVNALPDASLAVVVDDGGGLLVVGGETLLEGVGVVVAALDKGLAGDVVLHVLLRGVEGAVVGAAGGRVDQTASDTGDEERVVNLQLNSMLERLLALLEHGVETLGLGDGSGETVKDETAREAVSDGDLRQAG